MKSPVTIGSFDLTTRHDLIMHLVGLSVDCTMHANDIYLCRALPAVSPVADEVPAIQ